MHKSMQAAIVALVIAPINLNILGCGGEPESLKQAAKPTEQGGKGGKQGEPNCKGKKNCPEEPTDPGTDPTDPVEPQPTCNRLQYQELLTNRDSWYTAEVAENGQHFLTLNDETLVGPYCLQSQTWLPSGQVFNPLPNCDHVGGASAPMDVVAAPDGWYARVIIPEINSPFEGYPQSLSPTTNQTRVATNQLAPTADYQLPQLGAAHELAIAQRVYLPEQPKTVVRGGASYDYSVLYLAPDGEQVGLVPGLEYGNGIQYQVVGDSQAAYLIYTWLGGTFFRVFSLQGGRMQFVKDVHYGGDVNGHPRFTRFFVVQGQLFADWHYYQEDDSGLWTDLTLTVKAIYPNNTREMVVAKGKIDYWENKIEDFVSSVGGTLDEPQVFYTDYDYSLGHGWVSNMLIFNGQDQLVRTVQPGRWLVSAMRQFGLDRWIGTLRVWAHDWQIERGNHVFLYDGDGNELDHVKFSDPTFGTLLNLATIGESAVVGRNMGWDNFVQPDGSTIELNDAGFLHFTCAP